MLLQRTFRRSSSRRSASLAAVSLLADRSASSAMPPTTLLTGRSSRGIWLTRAGVAEVDRLGEEAEVNMGAARLTAPDPISVVGTSRPDTLVPTRQRAKLILHSSFDLGQQWTWRKPHTSCHRQPLQRPDLVFQVPIVDILVATAHASVSSR